MKKSKEDIQRDISLIDFHVPTEWELDKARNKLGREITNIAKLCRCTKDDGSIDYHKFGVMLGEAGENEDRHEIPYIAPVVRAWCNGELVPPREEQDTLLMMISDKEEEKYDQFCDVLETANFSAPMRINKVSKQLSQAFGISNVQEFAEEIGACKRHRVSDKQITEFLRGELGDSKGKICATIGNFLIHKNLEGSINEEQKQDIIKFFTNARNLEEHSNHPYAGELQRSVAQCMQYHLYPIMNYQEFAEKAADKGFATNRGNPHPHSAISQIKEGERAVPYRFAYVLEEILHSSQDELGNPIEIDPLSAPTTLFDLELRRIADDVWAQAEEAKDDGDYKYALGLMLKSCRLRMGLQGTQMSEILPGNYSHAAISLWENGSHSPSTHTVIEAYAALTKIWEKTEHNPGYLVRDKLKSWMDDDRWKTLSDTFNMVVNTRTTECGRVAKTHIDYKPETPDTVASSIESQGRVRFTPISSISLFARGVNS